MFDADLFAWHATFFSFLCLCAVKKVRLRFMNHSAENELVHILPRQTEGKMVLSRLRNLCQEYDSPSGLAIKYVLSGNEDYIIDGQRYTVGPNKYLIINAGHSYQAEIISSHSAIEGICIDIGLSILTEVYSILGSDTDFLLGHCSFNDKAPPSFFEYIQDDQAGATGAFLRTLTRAIYSSYSPIDAREFYYDLAENLMCDQVKVNRQIEHITAKKTSVKQELFRRVYFAKYLMDESFTEQATISDYASKACLSEFHFLRTFRQVFHITPYQYLSDKRVSFAEMLLSKGQYSLMEIAYQCGYNTVHGFIKAFKKKHTLAPLQYLSAKQSGTAVKKAIMLHDSRLMHDTFPEK